MGVLGGSHHMLHVLPNEHLAMSKEYVRNSYYCFIMKPSNGLVSTRKSIQDMLNGLNFSNHTTLLLNINWEKKIELLIKPSLKYYISSKYRII